MRVALRLLSDPSLYEVHGEWTTVLRTCDFDNGWCVEELNRSEWDGVGWDVWVLKYERSWRTGSAEKSLNRLAICLEVSVDDDISPPIDSWTRGREV